MAHTMVELNIISIALSRFPYFNQLMTVTRTDSDGKSNILTLSPHKEVRVILGLDCTNVGVSQHSYSVCVFLGGVPSKVTALKLSLLNTMI